MFNMNSLKYLDMFCIPLTECHHNFSNNCVKFPFPVIPVTSRGHWEFFLGMSRNIVKKTGVKKQNAGKYIEKVKSFFYNYVLFRWRIYLLILKMWEMLSKTRLFLCTLTCVCSFLSETEQTLFHVTALYSVWLW